MKGLNIPDSGLNVLMDEVRRAFSNELLQRGFDAYLRGAVISLRVEHNLELKGVYQTADGTFKVELDLDFFGLSQCSCGAGEYCVHMAAVFFKAYELSGRRPEVFMVERKLEQDEVKQAEALQTKRRTMQQVKAAKYAANSPPLPKPDGSPGEWHRFFEMKVGGNLRAHSTQPQGVTLFYRKVLEQLFPVADSWEPNLQHLFRLHALLFALGKIDGIIREYSHTYHFYYINQYLAEVMQSVSTELHSIIVGIDKQKLEERHIPPLLGVRDFLAEFAFPDQVSRIDWLGLYRQLWSQLLAHSDNVAKECKWLEAELLNTRCSTYRRDRLISSLAFFDFYRGDDKAALERLESLEIMDPSESLSFLHTLAANSLWGRLYTWLKFLGPSFKNKPSYLSDAYFQYWRLGAMAHADDREWRELLVHVFPLLYAPFTEYLLDRRQASELVRMYFTHGYGAASIPKNTLKRIEQEDPELVLPMYHQEVERCIIQKNRDAYKDAVRYMKKLAQLYKKRKEKDRWQMYLDHVASTYSRLRALQEELKKGKLIT